MRKITVFPKVYRQFNASCNCFLSHTNKPIPSWLPVQMESNFINYKVQILSEFQTLTKGISVHSNHNSELSQRWNKLRPIVDILENLDSLMKIDDEVEEMIKSIVSGESHIEEENELREMADLERQQRANHRHALEEKLLHLLVPVESTHLQPGVVLELIAGAGGREAGLFARELLEMYRCLALQHNWYFVIEQESTMSGEETTSSGSESPLSYARIGIDGPATSEYGIHSLGAYGQLLSEAGVHRVQRVPVTSRQQKIHTSTVAVSVLPVSKECEVNITESDLKWDYFRASGAGGQHVNKTDSAVRVTHLPTGFVVACQRERSQILNKRLALQMLVDKIKDTQSKSYSQSISSIRRSHIGNLDRSEKIRTYNYPQDRVTDHRLERSWTGVQRFMGQTMGLSEAITEWFESERLRRLAAVLSKSYIK